jgi:hypothetical protein
MPSTAAINSGWMRSRFSRSASSAARMTVSVMLPVMPPLRARISWVQAGSARFDGSRSGSSRS